MYQSFHILLLVNPRGQMERVQDKMTKEAWQMAKRAEGAHHNGLETLPLFYGAIVSVPSLVPICILHPNPYESDVSGTQSTTFFRKDLGPTQDVQDTGDIVQPETSYERLSARRFIFHVDFADSAQN